MTSDKEELNTEKTEFRSKIELLNKALKDLEVKFNKQFEDQKESQTTIVKELESKNSQLNDEIERLHKIKKEFSEGTNEKEKYLEENKSLTKKIIVTIFITILIF